MNCKRCGARLPRGVAICPECGARQRQHAGRVRCAQCGKPALAELTVCPHCGRSLRPAGPRWGLWLTGAVAIVLAGMMLFNQLPIRAAWEELIRVQERVAGLVQIPELPPTQSPGTTESSGVTGPTPASRTPALSTPKASQALSVTLTVIRPSATVSPTSGATNATTPVAATATSVQPSPTPSAPSQTPTATEAPATAPPTAMPTAIPTADTVRYYTVRAGDTFIDIGNATGIPWEKIAAENGMTSRSLLLPGMKLRLPNQGSSTAAGPTAAPAATATPAARRTYRVQAGDSLLVIGNKFGIPWQNIAQANGLTAPYALQVGQELIIPAN